MKKKLRNSGNGWEFYFSKPLLKILGYNPKENKLLITAKNNSLKIMPIFENEISNYQYNMVKNFQKSGGSYGVYFPQELIEILEINPIEVQIDENIMILSKF